MKTSFRIALKTLIFFIVFNLVFIFTNPLGWLGKVSLYNSVFPGRPRLPWGEAPQRAYNLTLNNLDAMFASHHISQPKQADEFRVVLIGDSSTWGFLLKPEDTLAANLNALNLTAKDGRKMRVYNLGYPDFSLVKDALLLGRAMRYQPDLVVWLVTLRSFPRSVQVEHALVQSNRNESSVALYPNVDLQTYSKPSLERLDLQSERRELADLVRLQLYGVLWAATGIDQHYPDQYEPLQKNYEKDDSFFNLKQPLQESDLAFNALAAGKRLTGNTPLIIVNEPMFISDGQNSDIRYNFFYPRWAYDQYRDLMPQIAAEQGWRYIDLWNLVPPNEFTNSAVHLSPAGSKMLAARLADEILNTPDP
jgi:hypothetical protein